jgi:hypothetical protein
MPQPEIITESVDVNELEGKSLLHHADINIKEDLLER